MLTPEEEIEERVKELVNTLEERGNAYIDILRENFGKGYTSDTNILLHVLGFSKKRGSERISKWYKETTQTLYLIQLYEVVKKIESERERGEHEKIQMFEEKLIQLLDSPKIRIVVGETSNDFLKILNPNLYNILLDKNHNRLSNDAKIIILSQFEAIPILTLDLWVQEILFKYDLKFINTVWALPKEFKKSWRELIEKKRI
jgi:hypothetical protein